MNTINDRPQRPKGTQSIEYTFNGVSLFGLGIIFVILKLAGAITWSWVWVTAPFWIGFAVIGIILITAGVASAFFIALAAIDVFFRRR